MEWYTNFDQFNADDLVSDEKPNFLIADPQIRLLSDNFAHFGKIVASIVTYWFLNFVGLKITSTPSSDLFVGY